MVSGHVSWSAHQKHHVWVIAKLLLFDLADVSNAAFLAAVLGGIAESLSTRISNSVLHNDTRTKEALHRQRAQVFHKFAICQ